MNRKIDLYLISGFLGSGKTTFLKNMLNNCEGKNVGILINEFGNIGIDGRLVEKDGIQLIEINNGSIFCSCLKGEFIKALIELSKMDIEILIIENSGMADPSNMHQILDEIADKVDKGFNYMGAVCIIDSTSFLKHSKILAPVQNQVASSNFIVVNKIDKVNYSTMKEIENRIREINISAYIYETMFADIPISILEDNLIDNGYIGETSNQPSNRPAAYSIESEGLFTDMDILEFIQRIGAYLFRMKGFMKKSTKWWQVDVVGDDISLIEIQLGKRDILTASKLVIIGKDTADFKTEINEAWEAVFHVKPLIYSDYDLCG